MMIILHDNQNYNENIIKYGAMIINIIITVVVLILIRIIWSQNSNDCNNDHNDYAIL